MNTEETAISSRLEEENRRLKTAVEELSILNDVAIAITSTQTIENIIELIVKKCIKHLKVEQGAVMLLDEKDQQNPFRTMIRKQDSLSTFLPYRLDTQLTGWVLKNKSPLLVNNLEEDKRFNFLSKDIPANENDFPLKSLLSVPMLLKGKITGLLTVFNKRSPSGFTADDQRLISIIAAQSAQVIENARLYREEAELRYLQEEIRVAHEIQADLLPAAQPALSGYMISGKSISAKEVGGDYYDYISIDNDRFAFCVGDIAGKGIPAALLMSNLQATLRAQISADKACRECISITNKMLYNNMSSNKFATLFYGILNPGKNEITYCNAGHNKPMLIARNNDIRRLPTTGMALGIVPDAPYEESIVAMEAGELMVIFSDGITEAMNNKEEEFGEERLLKILLNNKNETADKIVETIFQEVKLFTVSNQQADDMTAVVIKREG